jgi:creatinine amidohydrolase
MFPDELEEACREFPAVYLPYGLCEPHGPHNALGMDALRAHAGCCEAARRHGGIVAPPFYWNVHEIGGYGSWALEMIGNARPWLTAYPPWMFFKSILYHLRTMDMLELKGAIVFTGHAGPHAEDMQRFIDLAQRHVAVRLAYFVGAGIANYHFDDGMDSGGHAGRGETSLLWATDPDCVDLSRLPEPGTPGPHFAMGGLNEKSSRRAGESAVLDLAASLGSKAADLIAAFDDEGPERNPMTFGELEDLWERVFIPELRDYASMRTDRPEPPQNSRWRKNWSFPAPR